MASTVIRSSSSLTPSPATSPSPSLTPRSSSQTASRALIDGDGNDTAWASMAEKAGVPVFSSTDTLGVRVERRLLRGTPVTRGQPRRVDGAAKKVGATKVALLYCTEYPQCAQAVPFYESVAKKFGVDLVYNAAVSGSAPNYLAQCLAAKAAGATGLFVASTSDTAVRVIGSCAKQGYTPHLLAGSGSYKKGFLGNPGTNGLVAADQQRSVLRHQLAGYQDDDEGLSTRPTPPSRSRRATTTRPCGTGRSASCLARHSKPGISVRAPR